MNKLNLLNDEETEFVTTKIEEYFLGLENDRNVEEILTDDLFNNFLNEIACVLSNIKNMNVNDCFKIVLAQAREQIIENNFINSQDMIQEML